MTERDVYRGLTPSQRVDAEAFLRFMDGWPQDEADFDPDEWARAEHMAVFLREHGGPGYDVPASFLAKVFRAAELFDALGRPGLDA